MNKLGCALPLQHHTMSGGTPFQAVASARMCEHEAAVVTSAQI